VFALCAQHLLQHNFRFLCTDEALLPFLLLLLLLLASLLPRKQCNSHQNFTSCCC
jgi:hypothetical protein